MSTGRNDPFAGARFALFATGLALSGWMLSRSQIMGDQLALIARGWLMAAEGVWVPFGNPTSAGGFEPGGLTSLVVGLPLFVWMDHRAPVVLILLCHVAAYALLDRVVRDALDPRARLLLAILYWLAPWRLYFSAFLWNPNYLFLTGAVHLFCLYAQRHRPHLLHTALVVSLTGLSFQLHPSVLVLVFSAVALWWQGYWKPHWGGVALGALVTFGSLVPWALEAAAHPEILPGESGFPGRGLVTVFPLLRGLLYWFRHASLWTSSKWMTDFDFVPALGPEADAVLGPLFFVLGRVVGPATVVLPLLAGLRLWRRRRALFRASASGDSGRLWLHGYAFWSFFASAFTYALAPTTVMMWQGLTVLHAAVLPLLLVWSAVLRRRRARLARRLLTAWLVLSLVLLVGMGLGSSMYRRGGHGAQVFVFSVDHPMLRDLGLTECCSIEVDPARGVGDPELLLDRLRRKP